MIDEFIIKNEVSAPELEVDEADLPDPESNCVSAITSLNLKDQNITTIIWATGFCGDFSYLKLPVLDGEGNPIHEDGISSVRGLYFLGFR